MTENSPPDLSGPRAGDAALKVEAFAGSGVHSDPLRSNYFTVHCIQPLEFTVISRPVSVLSYRH